MSYMRALYISAMIDVVLAVPTAVRPLWVGGYTDVILEGSDLTDQNTIIVSSDSGCTGSALSFPIEEDGTLRFEGVENLPDTGYVCWCPQAHPCPEMVAFAFTLDGPTGISYLSAIVGTSFDVEIEGTGLTVDDRLLFTAADCGQARSESGMFVADKPSMRYGQRFDAYVTTLDTLSICWCPGMRGCINDTMYSVFVGNVSASGPAFNQVINITAGMEFSVVLSTTMATEKDFIRITEKGACGTAHTERLAFKVCNESSCEYRNDGSPNIFNATMERWDHFMLSLTGEYSICWCHDSTYDHLTGETYSAACRPRTTSAFSAEVGLINVSGVPQKQFTCEAWKECQFSFGNVGDGIVSVTESTLCDGTKTFLNDDMYIQEDGKFTVPLSPPGTRKLCYCDIEKMGMCDHGSFYRQVLGTLITEGHMVLKSQDLFQCTPTACSIELHGIGFNPADLVTLGTVCPTSAKEPLFRLASLTKDSSIFEAEGPLVVNSYVLCFCSYSESGQCTADFPHSVGRLVVISAQVDGLPECRLGLPCSISVSAQLPFQNGDAIWIHSDGFGPQPIVISVSTSNTYQITVTTEVVTAQPQKKEIEVSYCSRLGKIINIAENCMNGQGFNPIGHVIVSSSLIPPLSFITPTFRAITVMVESPYANGIIYCAASASNQSSVPTTAQIANLDLENPLGSGNLRAASRGSNLVHIDLGNSLVREQLDMVHIWCVRDANCTHMRCAIPHDTDGAVLHVSAPGPSAKEVSSLVGETVEIMVQGLLMLGAKVLVEGNKWVNCVGDTTKCVSQATVTTPGILSVHFCDRYFFGTCGIVVPVSQVTIMGPFPESLVVPPLVLPLSATPVVLEGIGMDQLHDLRSCNQNSSAIITLLDSNFTTSVWTVVPGGEEGVYEQLCFFTGKYHMDKSNVFLVETFIDCEVGEWEWQTDCSVSCGRGSRIRTRSMVVAPVGKGAACPVSDEEQPCGAPCPPIFFIGAHVSSGESVVVDEAFFIDVFAENIEDFDRLLVISRSEACGDNTRVETGTSCTVAASNRLICGNGTAELKIRSPGDFRACFCDASRNGCLESASYDLDLEIYLRVTEPTPPPEKGVPLSIQDMIIISAGVGVVCLGLMCLVVKKYLFARGHTRYQQKTAPADDTIAQEVLREVWNSYNRLDKQDGTSGKPQTFLDMPLQQKDAGTTNANVSHTSGWTNCTTSTMDPSKPAAQSTERNTCEPVQYDSSVFWADPGAEDSSSDGFYLGESASAQTKPVDGADLFVNMFGDTASLSDVEKSSEGSSIAPAESAAFDRPSELDSPSAGAFRAQQDESEPAKEVDIQMADPSPDYIVPEASSKEIREDPAGTNSPISYGKSTRKSGRIDLAARREQRKIQKIMRELGIPNAAQTGEKVPSPPKTLPGGVRGAKPPPYMHITPPHSNSPVSRSGGIPSPPPYMRITPHSNSPVSRPGEPLSPVHGEDSPCAETSVMFQNSFSLFAGKFPLDPTNEEDIDSDSVQDMAQSPMPSECKITPTPPPFQGLHAGDIPSCPHLGVLAPPKVPAPTRLSEFDAPRSIARKTVESAPDQTALSPKTVGPAPDQTTLSPKTVGPAPDQTSPSPETVGPTPQTAPSPEKVESAPQTAPSPETVESAPQTAPSPETVGSAPDQIAPPEKVESAPAQTAPSPEKVESAPQTAPSPETVGSAPDQIAPPEKVESAPDQTNPADVGWRSSAEISSVPCPLSIHAKSTTPPVDDSSCSRRSSERTMPPSLIKTTKYDGHATRSSVHSSPAPSYELRPSQPRPGEGTFKVMHMPRRVMPRPSPHAVPSPVFSDDYAQHGYVPYATQYSAEVQHIPSVPFAAQYSEEVQHIPSMEDLSESVERDPPRMAYEESVSPQSISGIPKKLSLGGRCGIGAQPKRKMPVASSYRREFGTRQREYVGTTALTNKSTGKLRRGNDSSSEDSE